MSDLHNELKNKIIELEHYVEILVEKNQELEEELRIEKILATK